MLQIDRRASQLKLLRSKRDGEREMEIEIEIERVTRGYWVTINDIGLREI